MEEPKKKPEGTAGAQADALEVESPAEDKAEGGKEEPGEMKRMGKAANQGSTTEAPSSKNLYSKPKTKAAPLPESSTADLAAAARKAMTKPAPKQMADMSDDEVDDMAKKGNLGAVAYRKQHPRKPKE